MGMISIPITLSKATQEVTGGSLLKTVAVNADGTVEQIDKTERLPSGKPIAEARKEKAVVLVNENSETEFRLIEHDQMAMIEEATNTPVLEVLAVQKLHALPLMFSHSTYYVRFNDKSKQHPKAFAILVRALAENRLGLIVKWGTDTKQKLCVLSVESGVMILRQIPYLTEIRPASDKERQHFKVEVSDTEVEKMSALLTEIQAKGFKYGEFKDEAFELRADVVAKVLEGEPVPVPEKAPEEQIGDIMALIDAEIEKAKA
jgi:non-homologous end joining protein Ku